MGVDDGEIVTLYRADGLNEADDIRAFGGFRPGPGSAFVEGKWFAVSRDHAVGWGQAMRPFLFASVTLPARLLAELGGSIQLDGIGPACFVRHDQLSLVNAAGTIVLSAVDPQEQR